MDEATAPSAGTGLARAMAYYELTKPGITRMVVLTAAAEAFLEDNGVTILPDVLVNIGGMAIFENITERRRLERELLERERHFRTLFADNPLPMWVYEEETLRFLEVNDAAVRKYGFSRDEFLRMQITDIRPPEEVPRLLSSVHFRQSRVESSGGWRHRP